MSWYLLRIMLCLGLDSHSPLRSRPDSCLLSWSTWSLFFVSWCVGLVNVNYDKINQIIPTERQDCNAQYSVKKRSLFDPNYAPYVCLVKSL